MPSAVKGSPDDGHVVLYWLPLGAGGRSVRSNGHLFEALVARHQHRAVRDLYHCALEVHIGADRFVIEMTPVWSGDVTDRGVMREGPVGRAPGWSAGLVLAASQVAEAGGSPTAR